MLRTVLSLLLRSLLFMAFGALLVVLASRFGPTLVAQALPPELRPDQSELAEMTPQRIIDAVRDIRGALE